MSKWIDKLIGIVLLLSAFNMVRTFGGNVIIDIAFLIVIVPIVLECIFGDKRNNVKKTEGPK